MTQKEKMHAGELYVCTDEELMREQLGCLELREISDHDKEYYFKNRKINL